MPIPADRNSKNPAPAFTCRFSVPSFKVAVGVLSDGGGLCHRVLVTGASRLSDVKSATSFIAVIKLALVVARMRMRSGRCTCSDAVMTLMY